MSYFNLKFLFVENAYFLIIYNNYILFFINISKKSLKQRYNKIIFQIFCNISFLWFLFWDLNFF